jgi:hypothetical protein
MISNNNTTKPLLQLKFPNNINNIPSTSTNISLQLPTSSNFLLQQHHKQTQIESTTKLTLTSSSTPENNTQPPPADDEIPDDAISCARALLQSCSRKSSTRTFPLAIPVILLHQVFVLQPTSHAKTEYALNQARIHGQLRFFYGNCGREKHDIFICEEIEYCNLVRKLLDAAIETETIEERNALDFFLHGILPINHHMTCEIQNETYGRILCRIGLLNRATTSIVAATTTNTTTSSSSNTVSYYEFAVPLLGVFCTELQAGRKELLRRVRRGNNNKNEILISRLPHKLKSSSIPLEYHINDLVGTGILLKRDSGVGGLKSMLVYNNHSQEFKMLLDT